MVYFTADLHLGHKNIVKTCNRPFSSVDEMDDILIENWNKKVKGNDTVYIVGDLIWKGVDPKPYLDRLKGKKILVRGNHDSTWLDKLDNPLDYFVEITPLLDTSICSRPTTLCHYPMFEWKGSRKIGSAKLSYLVHGHTHGNIRPEYLPLFSLPNALNAGVDVNGFAPVTFDELLENNEIFKEKAIKILSDN